MTPDDVKYYRLIASDRVGLNLVGRVIVFILCDEVQKLQAENARLLEVIRLQAATQPGTVKNKRLYKFSGSTKLYLKSDCESYTQDRRHAGLFSEEEWLEWGQESGLQKEAIGEDEQMKLVGAPTLPGLEL